jgi:type IV secretory pathway VirB6-like protein
VQSIFFTTMFTTYNTSLITASQTVANSLLSIGGPQLTGAITLVIVVIGVMMLFHKMTLADGTLWVVKAIMIASILSTGMYTQYVQTMFLTTIPNMIASTIGTAASGLTVPQQFDLLRSAADHNAAAMLAATSHIDQLGQNISIRFAINGIDFFLFCCFVVDLLAAALAAVVAPAGAVLLIFYLFQHTRRWAENWIGKMVSLMLLQLFVAILLQVIIAQFTGYMRTSEAQSVSGIDIDEAINALWSIAWTFGVGLLLLVSLPAIASSIGGGHVSNLVVAPIRFGQVQMARAVASGIRAANRSSGRISNAATSARSATPTAPSSPPPSAGANP